MSNSNNLITFEIQWLGWKGSDHVIATTEVRKRDLSAAIVAANNLMKPGKSGSWPQNDAHGFFCRVKR